MTGELSPASVYVGLLPVVEACVVVGVRGCVGEVRVAADEAVDLDPGVLALPWEYSSTTTGFSPHPCTKRRLRVLRPCPPPGKRQRRLNAPYAGSPSPLQRLVVCLQEASAPAAPLPFIAPIPRQPTIWIIRGHRGYVHHDPRASPRCNGLTLDIGRRGLEPEWSRRGRATTLSTTPHGREHRTIVYYGRGTPGTASILKSVTWRRTPGPWQSLFHYR